MDHADFLLENYRYELPPERIAQRPAERRDRSRLLVVDRAGGSNTAADFRDLGTYLPEGALLVANNSRVVPARMHGTKESGGKVEFLLLTPLPLLRPEAAGGGFTARAEGLLRASKSPKEGSHAHFPGGLSLTVLGRGPFGRCEVELSWQGDLAALLEQHGEMPLPPYIHRPVGDEDAARYQTTYAAADKAGSVAAPTAGLHFTPELRAELAGRGISWAEVTLFVGYGTFSPVREADIRNHRMHKEYIEISAATASAVHEAKEQGRPVVAIGTTSARTLEGMYRETGKITEYRGDTDIFIYPGHRFQVVDKLLTNFHLPESSLIIMIAALAGRQRILDSYREALAKGFRFFSYGDAMLIS